MFADLGRGTVVTFYVTAVLVVLALIVAAVFAFTSGFFISRENLNVRDSVGYSQAANERCGTDIQQFLDAKKAGDAAHMRADYNDCRSAVSGVPPEHIDSNVSEFLATNGQ